MNKATKLEQLMTDISPQTQVWVCGDSCPHHFLSCDMSPELCMWGVSDPVLSQEWCRIVAEEMLENEIKSQGH